MNTQKHLDWHNLLDDRQFKEVIFATFYAQNFNHGTAGHNRLLLIAKLASIIDTMETPAGQNELPTSTPDTETVA